MILVFLLLIIFVFVGLVLISKIEVNVKNLDMSNINKKENNEKLIIQISLKIFGLQWIKFKLNKDKLAGSYVKRKLKMEEQNFDAKEETKKILKVIKGDEKIRREIKSISLRLQNLHLDLKLGTEDVILTSQLVGITSIIISNILPHIININRKTNLIEQYKYRISPIYANENFYKINLNCIFNAKLVHIIYVIYLIRRRSDKYERASNRKSYEYSYE